MFLFTTSRCISCRELLTRSENALCLTCHQKMARTFMLPKTNNIAEQRIEEACRISWAYSHYLFSKGESIVRDTVHEFKYHDNPRLAYEMGREVGEYMKQNGMTHLFDLLVPVPISWYRRLKRGYNQAGEFARGVSEATGIEMREDILKRISWASSLSTRNAEDRKKVMGSKAFIAKKAISEVRNRKIAIVDDVLTTGSTLGACVNAIREKEENADIGILTFSINE